MQDFQCIYIKNKYGDKAEMFITDTDNLMCKTETKNAYEDLFTKKELFDFSNYPKVSKYYNGANNSVAGNIKDEINSMPIKDFAELKSKMCVLILVNLKNQKLLVEMVLMMK